MSIPTVRAGLLPVGTPDAESHILAEIDGRVARVTRADVGSYVSSAFSPYPTRDALIAAVAVGDLDDAPDGAVYGFLHQGYALSVVKEAGETTLPGLPDFAPVEPISTLHWGTGETASPYDNAALTAAVAYAQNAGKSLKFQGQCRIGGAAVPVSGAPRMHMDDWGSRVILIDGNHPAFEVDLTGSDDSPEVLGMRVECSAVSTNLDNGFMSFVGDAGELLQRGRIEGNTIRNTFRGFIYDVLPRTSSFGLEGGVNWMDFSDNHYINIFTAHHFRNGSGTGNTWMDEKPAIRPGGTYWHHDPETSGTVAGDVIISGVHGSGVGGAAAFIRIESGTVYGAQFSITNNQFDADLIASVILPDDHVFENFTMIGNNWGGNSRLGADIKPIRSSVIMGRDVSEWKEGNVKESTATGAVLVPMFDVFVPSGGVWVTVKITSSDIPGIGPAAVVGQYWVTESAGAAVVTEFSKHRSSTAAGALDIVFSDATVTDVHARLRASFTQNSAGTARLQANIQIEGESAFKALRR